MRPRCTNNGGVLADRVHFFFSVSLSALDYIFRHMWCVPVCVCARVPARAARSCGAEADSTSRAAAGSVTARFRGPF